MEELKLPPAANKLWRRAGARIAELLAERGFRVTIGGGTILAARWGGHRRSYDIDLKVPKEDAPRIAATFADPAVRRFIGEAGGRTDDDEYDPAGPYTIDFPDTGVGQHAQRIEVFGGDPVPRTGAEAARVNTRMIAVASTTQILAGKLKRMGANVPRDLFDLVTAKRLDPQALTEAVNTMPKTALLKGTEGWRRNGHAITRNSLVHITGVDLDERKRFDTLHERAAAACAGAAYARVRASRDDDAITVRYNTEDGTMGSIRLSPDTLAVDMDRRGLTDWTRNGGRIEGLSQALNKSARHESGEKRLRTAVAGTAPEPDAVIQARGEPAAGGPARGREGGGRCR